MHHAEEKGAKKANRIKTSGAFHTTAMAGAQETLSKMLDNMEIRLPEKIAVYSNVTGKPYTSVAEMRALLKRQVVEPVAWEASMKEIISQGVTKIVLSTNIAETSVTINDISVVVDCGTCCLCCLLQGQDLDLIFVH